MRLIIVIMTTFLLQVSASGFGQRITLTEVDAPLEQVLNKIKVQSKMNILFADDIFDQAKKVSVKLSDIPLKDALDKVLEGQALSYELSDNTIVIRRKEASFVDKTKSAILNLFRSIDVHGRVVDANGQPLVGASVGIKGKGNKAASTNSKGEFSLQNVDEGAVLLISFIGYAPKEVKASKDVGGVVLELSLSKLDEFGDFTSFK
ncbi:STN domain-containing protein [Pedobacter foliorum]|uniref:STN domain-containing protein n=1 Tax=Pedobacter foliorum TaxID=2739058 RepID=UPI001563D2AD|nr:STN domain-containing protein [Pedobacter foliorum]NRF41188.1 carboxypeptidase-like regulatory domain-containing protein [Pedobacter foliorum]